MNDQGADAKPSLAKGIEQDNPRHDPEYLQEQPEWLLYQRADRRADPPLSRITIRRYCNYMVDTGGIISTMDYKTGGRPSIKYGFGQNDLPSGGSYDIYKTCYLLVN